MRSFICDIKIDVIWFTFSPASQAALTSLELRSYKYQGCQVILISMALPRCLSLSLSLSPLLCLQATCRATAAGGTFFGDAASHSLRKADVTAAQKVCCSPPVFPLPLSILLSVRSFGSPARARSRSQQFNPIFSSSFFVFRQQLLENKKVFLSPIAFTCDGRTEG